MFISFYSVFICELILYFIGMFNILFENVVNDLACTFLYFWIRWIDSNELKKSKNAAIWFFGTCGA